MHRVGQFGSTKLVRNQELRSGPLVGGCFVFLDSDLNPCHSYSVLYRGCPLVGGSVMGGSTVHCLHKYTRCFVLNYLCFRVPFRLARELKQSFRLYGLMFLHMNCYNPFPALADYSRHGYF